MKKVIAAIISVSAVMGCARNNVQQQLQNALLISPGMTKQEVLEVMGGQPVKSEFSGAVEEWHYCKTGYGSDEFIAVFFSEGITVAMRPYTVTLKDAKGATGSCEKFIKMGSYREPSEVKELRVNIY